MVVEVASVAMSLLLLELSSAPFIFAAVNTTFGPANPFTEVTETGVASCIQLAKVVAGSALNT